MSEFGRVSAEIISHSALRAARVLASQFVQAEAEATAAEIGFRWSPVPVAPATFADLEAAYAHAAATGEPLPVSDEHSETVVFTAPSINHALRFWHDVHHVRLGLSFALADELELAVYLLSVAEADGIAEGSVTWQLLRADFVGQVYLLGISRQYPLDQWRFAEGCVRDGLDRGLLEECRRSARP